MTETPPPSASPAAIYADRLAARRASAAVQAARLDKLSYARLGMFLAGVIVAGLAFGAQLFSPWFALVPVAGFLYLVAKFEMARGRKVWAERAAGFYAGGLDRLAGKPSGAGNGERFADESHPYAADLDLFGPGSVFERLTACRTRVGEDTLAAWLMAPADPAEVKARQEAVADLKPRLDLRESVAVAGANAPAADYHPLAEWASSPSPRLRGEGSERSERVRGESEPTPHPPLRGDLPHKGRGEEEACSLPSDLPPCGGGGEPSKTAKQAQPPNGEPVGGKSRPNPSPGGRLEAAPAPQSGFAPPPSPRNRSEGQKPWKRWAVEVLGWANVLAWVGWLFVGTTALPVLVFGLLSLVLAVPLLPWAWRVLAPLEKVERDLSLLEAVLARLEREHFTAARLKELQAAMVADGVPASRQIGELRRLLEWYNSRRNAFFLPVAILRMWDVRFAFLLGAWRARSGPAVARWLRAVGEAEALSSLAGYAFENPDDLVPTILPSPRRGEGGEPSKTAEQAQLPTREPGEGAAHNNPLTPNPSPQRGEGNQCAVSFAAVGLGHPLIPATRCVRNDVTLGGESGPRVLIVSGSNMSGKSTLLRAVGVNAVLALAGGVVRATSLALAPLAVGATMRVQDSLQAGRSRFFAEVTKVRQLLDTAQDKSGPPLLFLLDELFAGTNSADRVAGAEGVVRALVAAGAVGFVTTHDLSLTAVTERIPGATNVHFCDGFAGGELHFDYTMRPGVVAHGNGLALMRAVGLKV